jgi:two-component system, LytTR family, response regulator
MEKIRTLIVDDEPLARRGIRAQLKDEKDIEIIFECRNRKRR